MKSFFGPFDIKRSLLQQTAKDVFGVPSTKIIRQAEKEKSHFEAQAEWNGCLVQSQPQVNQNFRDLIARSSTSHLSSFSAPTRFVNSGVELKSFLVHPPMQSYIAFFKSG